MYHKRGSYANVEISTPGIIERKKNISLNQATIKKAIIIPISPNAQPAAQQTSTKYLEHPKLHQ